MTTRAALKAYLETHVKTPRCSEWRQIVSQLSEEERDQLIRATEAEADTWREATERDLAENTLESFAACIEAARRLEWAEVKVAQQIMASRT